MGGEFLDKGAGNSLTNKGRIFYKTDKEFFDTEAGISLTNWWRIS
jgi:hypothetical protein